MAGGCRSEARPARRGVGGVWRCCAPRLGALSCEGATAAPEPSAGAGGKAPCA